METASLERISSSLQLEVVLVHVFLQFLKSYGGPTNQTGRPTWLCLVRDNIIELPFV